MLAYKWRKRGRRVEVSLFDRERNKFGMAVLE
jgi:hypothetical protein